MQYAYDVLVEADLAAEVRTLYELNLKRWRDEQDRIEYSVKKALDLFKQGYSTEQIKTMLRKKA